MDNASNSGSDEMLASFEMNEFDNSADKLEMETLQKKLKGIIQIIKIKNTNILIIYIALQLKKERQKNWEMKRQNFEKIKQY